MCSVKVLSFCKNEMNLDPGDKGYDPKAYIEACLTRPGFLKLVQYNDSLGSCGSCVDRHAHISTGEGMIGFPTMSEIASLCSSQNIPMVIE